MPSLNLDSLEQASDAQLLAFISQHEEPNVTATASDVLRAIAAFEAYCADEERALAEYRIFQEANFDAYSEAIPFGSTINFDMVSIIYEYANNINVPNLSQVKNSFARAKNNSYRSRLLEQATKILKQEISEEQYIDEDIRALKKELEKLDPLLKHFVIILHELEVNETNIANAFGVTRSKPNSNVLPEITKGLARFAMLDGNSRSTAQERDSLLAILQAKYDLLAFAHNYDLLKILHNQIAKQREILSEVGMPSKTPPPPPMRNLLNVTDRLLMVQTINRRLFAQTEIKTNKEREVEQIQEFLAERAKAIATQAAKIEKSKKESIKQKVVDVKDDTFNVLRELSYPIQQAADAVYGMMSNVITSSSNTFDFAQEFVAEVGEQAEEIRRERDPFKAVKKIYNLASYVSEMFTYVNDVKAEKTSYVTDKFAGFKDTAYKHLSYVWNMLDSLWNKVQNLLGRSKRNTAAQENNNPNKKPRRMPLGAIGSKNSPYSI